MSEWFQAKVEFLRQMDNGIIKKITEQYLVDSMSFTECEARVLKEQGEGVREVTCKSIARSPIKEVAFYGDTDMWHKVKVTYSLMDEETEKEKKVTTYLLVNSNDVKEAYERTEEHLKEMLVPFQIPKIEESPIIEVFQYEKQAPKGFVKVAGSERDAADKIIESKLGTPSDEHHEEECAMEESHEVESIDPTAGQAVAFEIDPLWELLDSLGVTAVNSQIEEIKHMHDTLPQDKFCNWMSQEFGLAFGVATSVYHFLLE